MGPLRAGPIPANRKTAQPSVERIPRPNDDSDEISFRSAGIDGWLMIFYFAGVLWFVQRLVVGTLLLRGIVSRSLTADGDTIAMASDCAKIVDLKQMPNIFLSHEIAFPMACGLLRPFVVLPTGFTTWSDHERRATLMHELIHIRRHDTVIRHLSAFNRVMYWFHPASWYLDRRLTESREWATDRELVDLASVSGLPAERYAACLVSVVARASDFAQRRSLATTSAIAMSASDDLEQRLRLVLDGKANRSISHKLWIRIAVGFVIAFAALSAVPFRITRAQVPQDTDQSPADAAASVQEPRQRVGQGDNRGPTSAAQSSNGTDPAAPIETAIKLDPADPGDEDLWMRIQRAAPREPAEHETAIAVIDLSGTVVAQDGRPIADAIVVLRDSSTQRISWGLINNPVESDEELHLRQVSDVLARTISDSQGRFEFKGVTAPTYRSTAKGTWSGDVVAAHPEIGVGFAKLGREKGRRRRYENTRVELTATTSLSGTYVTPAGEPIPNATVSLFHLIAPAADPWSEESLDLQCSQLTLRTRSDQQGQFTFHHVPQSMFASFWVLDPDSAGAVGNVPTSDELTPADANSAFFLRTPPAFDRPIRLVADPGVKISGRIRDSNGNAVADAIVHFGGLVKRARSDRNGRVEYLVSTRDIAGSNPDKSTRSDITLGVRFEDGSGYLPSSQRLDVESLLAGKPFDVIVEKGVSISGTVVDRNGASIEGISVLASAQGLVFSDESDESGLFDLTLPPGKHAIVFCSEQDGWDLPTASEARRQLDASESIDGSMRSVDVSDGSPVTLDPVVIAKSQSIQVIVSLPDGSPARDANVILRDEETRQMSSGRNDTRVVEKADPATTNALGRASLLPRGIVSDGAWVDVSSTGADDVPYKGSAKISESSNGVLSMVLSRAPRLEGRVLLNGRPVAGAKVAIGESRPAVTSSGGRSVTSFRVANNQIVTTDAKGIYTLPVSNDKRYSVHVQSIPGESNSVGTGYSATPSGGEKVSVRDFQFYRGSEQIAGRVVDADGNPVADARVHVLRHSDANPNLWLGHHEASQWATDLQGRFVLRRMPPGKFRIIVSGKRPADRSQRAPTNMVTVPTGTTDLTVRLVGANVDQPLPRLKPIRVRKTN
ncbi:carboxypeptidase regulatory-like domain-containing protein [Roseiconus nitratireducens]|uniref:carboxypeptidase regulatory-like domain-containing protein n=1 Tax=Roseiconus nitratireducens TaxID=2605748 RepID=UPI0021BCA834|nr:carboxypeptidase regulatory-like domain-containing protein [Roseiconus nitratireducens]